MPLIIVCGLIRPVGRQLSDRRQDQPPIDIAWGTASVVGCAALGLVLALAAPGPPGQAARILAYAVGGGSVLAFVLYGLGYALVHSWISRNADWAVPVLAPALALCLHWFGGLLHTMYFQAGFGVPSDAIHVSCTRATRPPSSRSASRSGSRPWCWSWPVTEARSSTCG
ncbi:hypothetical protein [Streptomyces cyaneofuscatus]|uniref:hypothetical protein n=1 Tax=Streptomyces cyaneofuscatus TaxID=66883 RepID=UPI0038028FB5